MWNVNIGNRQKQQQFTLEEVRVFFDHLAAELEHWEELEDPLASKDTLCACHYNPPLNGISNGEYFFCAFQILAEMLSNLPAETAPYCKQAVLRAILNCIEEDFLHSSLEGNNYCPIRAKQLLTLLQACDSGRDPAAPINPPAESGTTADGQSMGHAEWQEVFARLRSALIPDEATLRNGYNFALDAEDPHWPTPQEYRRARAWIFRYGGED